jgi:hypothetical protein
MIWVTTEAGISTPASVVEMFVEDVGRLVGGINSPA